jgi:predicted site-specific integrase-resolvase
VCLTARVCRGSRCDGWAFISWQYANWNCEVIKDLGSGLNYKKKGLRKLIDSILNNECDRIVISHKDRLLRFGSELVFSLCEHFGVEVIILNRKEDSSFEEDLACIRAGNHNRIFRKALWESQS